MKIDPNQPIELTVEHILCEGGRVLMHDGSSTPASELDSAGSALQAFCRTIDPNRCFIEAYVPADSDRDVFFRARDAARGIGVHMQAPVERAEVQRERWKSYCRLKQLGGS